MPLPAPRLRAVLLTGPLLACTDGPLTVPIEPAPPAIVTVPAIAATAPNAIVTFAAHDDAGVPRTVTWRVNGVTGGTPQLGVISSGGTYTAPATIPAGDSVVVTAVSPADTTVQHSSTVFFVPDETTRDYYVVLPRVVDATEPAPLRILLVPPATAAAVTFLPDAGDPLLLAPIGANVLTFELNAATSLASYTTGTLHNPVGRLDYRTAAGERIKLTNFSVNVRDPTTPDVAITSLGPEAQRSPYILNIRIDTVTTYPSNAMVARALELLGGDHFDFVAVVATVTTNNNRSFGTVRNDVAGIGLPVGGTGRLRGVISFPIDAFFDGAEQGMLHEIGHSWINFATDEILGPARPHWPPSTMASGTMGFNIPGGNVGGTFSWALTPLGDGTVRINQATPSDRFTPIDLYLMGLLPPDSVPPMYVLPPTADVNAFTDGMISPATTYTIDDYIAAHGPRVPSSASAQRDFTAAVVVLTYGRLLTSLEMAFFDHASARAETTVPVESQSGLARRLSSGFFLATGGRATLRTRLP